MGRVADSSRAGHGTIQPCSTVVYVDTLGEAVSEVNATAWAGKDHLVGIVLAIPQQLDQYEIGGADHHM